MIQRLDLRHFKCFEALYLPLESLTLLSGTNASGKSSVLQSLVLLHQTTIDDEWATRLQLNGSEIQLGSVRDVLNRISGRDSFEIGLQESDVSVLWRFVADEKTAMSARVSELLIDDEKADIESLNLLLPLPRSTSVHSIARKLEYLTFLTAERVGPRDIYPLKDPSAPQVVGPRGENAVGMLYLRRDEEIAETLALADAPPTLLRQVEARMCQFFPACGLDIQPVSRTNYVTLGLSTSNDVGFNRPLHTGFGLTQVLPIVVAALSAKEGDLLLIENPEVHLHPKGQSKVGAFLSEVAASGVQVIVETHSDHVLNGIRRAVKSGVLPHENTAIHFFEHPSEDVEQVVSPTLDSNGNIDIWPSGFFDQFDTDMNYFAGWGE
ncbi:MAG: DUF3696 domain-containing protein [Verrucomicrobiaceae bacterium]|nr:MAG: DUF3696 domain-containing protein [Verrucomicrobiaceae bacterium]